MLGSRPIIGTPIHRLFESKLPPVNQVIELSEDNVKIANSVLRLEKGSFVELINGKGTSALGRIEEIRRKRVQVQIQNVKQHTPLRPEIVLFQGIPKQSKPSWIIQKSVELGVQKIIFFETSRTIPKIKSTSETRWQRIAIEALRQSGNPFLPEVLQKGTLSEALCSPLEGELRVVLDEREKDRWLAELCKQSSPSSIHLVIGPEGGWSDADREVLRSQGYVSARLAHYVLRTETAALAAISFCRGFFCNSRKFSPLKVPA